MINKQDNKKNSNKTNGYLLIQVLIFSVVGLIIVGGLINWASSSLKLSRHLMSREQAFHIAEAGIEYYRWHLAHAPTDFHDGQPGSTGPYIHNYKDKDGNIIGQFSLTITPPPVGSTIVKIVSEGMVFDGSSAKRTIESQLAIPSLAKYAVVANAKMRFGEGTVVLGPIHSNDGIRFDGVAHNIVTSAQASYYDPDHSGGLEYGVHTHISPVDPLPPAPVPNRPNVFMAGRQFPVPATDFTGLTADLANLKARANTPTGRYLSPSGAQGYRLLLKTNNTFDVYKVTSIDSPKGKCSNTNNQTGWGSWSINKETFVANYSFPANGVIFVEDHVWVSGQINKARLLIASGRFPESVNTHTSITVNNDLKYTNYDGQDVIGLIAQNNFNVGLDSEDDLQIDAALVAKNGRVGRFYYDSNCTGYQKSKLTLFGMISTDQRYGFAYTDGTGYAIRNIIYDGNLLYGPPPSFPLTSDQYEIISWREL